MTIHSGDCLDVMATLDAESIDAIVTDPPYDLLSASRNGSRRTPPSNAAGNPVARHDRGGAAGGFMGKAWDGTGVAFDVATWEAALRVAKPSAYLLAFGGTRTVHRMTAAIEDAGWIIRDMLVWAYASGFPKSKASLKPAWEPIVMARKPGPLRALAIDECRIGVDEGQGGGAKGTSGFAAGYEHGDGFTPSGVGRWPANVILTDPIFDGGWAADRASFPVGREASVFYGDSGTYSRFFLIPKAARSDREPVLLPLRDAAEATGTVSPRANHHPTVKPVDLMRHLVRLVTPAGGTVLDPFLGSGTTALAAEMEGFGWVGIEKEPEYVAIAEARLNGVPRGLGL